MMSKESQRLKFYRNQKLRRQVHRVASMITTPFIDLILMYVLSIFQCIYLVIEFETH